MKWSMLRTVLHTVLPALWSKELAMSRVSVLQVQIPKGNSDQHELGR